MFFELIESSYGIAEIVYTVGLFLLSAFAAIWFHSLGHYIMQIICMKKDISGFERESPNPLKAFSLKNIFSVAVMFVFSFARLGEVKSLSDSRPKNMLISVSGVFTNFLLAFVSMLGYDILVVMEWNEAFPEYGTLFQSFFMAFASVNLSIAIFNILPLPSLDGGIFISQFMPEKFREKYLSWKRYALFIVTVAIVFLSRSGIADSLIGGTVEFFDSVILGFMQKNFGVTLY